MIEIKHKAPAVSEYRNLRKIAGLSEKSQKAAAKGLTNACFDVSIYDNQLLIGMGRVIGDGGTAFQIIDIAVNPNYQGQGYGKLSQKICANGGANISGRPYGNFHYHLLSQTWRQNEHRRKCR